MKTKSILLLVIIASAMIKVFVCICFSAHSCNDPGPGLGGVEAPLGGDGGQEPRGQRRGQLQQRLYRGTHVPW